MSAEELFIRKYKALTDAICALAAAVMDTRDAELAQNVGRLLGEGEECQGPNSGTVRADAYTQAFRIAEGRRYVNVTSTLLDYFNAYCAWADWFEMEACDFRRVVEAAKKEQGKR